MREGWEGAGRVDGGVGGGRKFEGGLREGAGKAEGGVEGGREVEEVVGGGREFDRGLRQGAEKDEGGVGRAGRVEGGVHCDRAPRQSYARFERWGREGGG